MSDQTIYLIQSDYAATIAILDQLARLHAPDDQVILMGESVLHLEHAFLQQRSTIYILEHDVGILASTLPTNVAVIGYPQLATLCLNFKRCISMK